MFSCEHFMAQYVPLLYFDFKIIQRLLCLSNCSLQLLSRAFKNAASDGLRHYAIHDSAIKYFTSEQLSDVNLQLGQILMKRNSKLEQYLKTYCCCYFDILCYSLLEVCWRNASSLWIDFANACLLYEQVSSYSFRSPFFHDGLDF